LIGPRLPESHSILPQPEVSLLTPSRAILLALSSNLLLASDALVPVLPPSMARLDMTSDRDGNRAYRVGESYYTQRGVFGLSKANAEQARAWFTKAAEKGHINAMLMLSRMFGTGEGVAKDKNQSLYWIDRAAVAGHTEAQDAIRRMGLAIGSLQNTAPAPTENAPTTPQSKAALATVEDQVSNLCEQISREMSAANKPSIAVVEFSNLDGQITELGKYLAEEITTSLFQTKRFKVIERQMLNKILREQKLQNSGMIDEESAKKLGKLLGVTAIVSGTVTELSSSVKVNARLIGTETGEIFGAASAGIVKDESIRMMLAKRSGSSENTLSVKTESSSQAETHQESATPSWGKPVIQDGFKFTLVKVSRDSSGEVHCEIDITNNEIDREIKIFAAGPNNYSCLYASNGGLFGAKKVMIGNINETYSGRFRFFNGTTNRLTLAFSNIPFSVNKASAIRLKYENENKLSEVYFKNINL